jgi:hypothetical protein
VISHIGFCDFVCRTAVCCHTLVPPGVRRIMRIVIPQCRVRIRTLWSPSVEVHNLEDCIIIFMEVVLHHGAAVLQLLSKRNKINTLEVL